EESGPLSGPRQMAARAVYKTPPRTSSAPSPTRNILASQFIAAPHNRTRIQAGEEGIRSGVACHALRKAHLMSKSTRQASSPATHLLPNSKYGGTGRFCPFNALGKPN